MFILKSAPHSMAKADTGESSQQGNGEDNRRRFAALLRPVAPIDDQDIQGTSPATAPSTGTEVPIAAPTRPGDMLHLRLTNGPCAGLEIEASERDGQLHVRLSAPNAERLEQALQGRTRLETELNTMFGRPITLELGNAASANQ